jgi:hypothetical protein
VIDLHPTFCHEFFDMAGAQRVGDIPADPLEKDFWGKCAPLKLLTIVSLSHVAS